MAITIEPSRDPELLAQYFALRERCYRRELNLPEFDGSGELADQLGLVLVAHEEGRCVGGARIVPASLSAWGLPRLNTPLHQSCAWERFILDPDTRSVDLARDFCAGLIQHSYQLGYRQALVLSSLRNARFYRRCHSALGVDFRIEHSIPDKRQSPFRGLEHYLSVSSFRSEPTIANLAA